MHADVTKCYCGSMMKLQHAGQDASDPSRIHQAVGKPRELNKVAGAVTTNGNLDMAKGVIFCKKLMKLSEETIQAKSRGVKNGRRADGDPHLR